MILEHFFFIHLKPSLMEFFTLASTAQNLYFATRLFLLFSGSFHHFSIDFFDDFVASTTRSFRDLISLIVSMVPTPVELRQLAAPEWRRNVSIVSMFDDNVGIGICEAFYHLSIVVEGIHFQDPTRTCLFLVLQFLFFLLPFFLFIVFIGFHLLFLQ